MNIARRLRASLPFHQGLLQIQASNLLALNKYSEAESVSREWLDTYDSTKKTGGRWHYMQFLLGHSLLGQKKYELAEPLLLDGYNGLKQQEQVLPPFDKHGLSIR